MITRTVYEGPVYRSRLVDITKCVSCCPYRLYNEQRLEQRVPRTRANGEISRIGDTSFMYVIPEVQAVTPTVYSPSDRQGVAPTVYAAQPGQG
ncbi:MAG TPA: hypothetical protein VGL94_17400, partial [Ktedonobacteraceae bacterium]